MAGENVNVVEVVPQDAHNGILGTAVSAGSSAQRGVGAEYRYFGLGSINPCDIGPEPVNLFLSETFSIFDAIIAVSPISVSASAYDIIHHDNMGVTDVERIVCGAECIDISGFGIIIAVL